MRLCTSTYSYTRTDKLRLFISAFLLAWYTCMITVLPLASNRFEAPDEDYAHASATVVVCTGMACSVSNAGSEPKSCCCTPEESTSPISYPYVISTDCTDTGIWDLTMQRTPWPTVPALTDSATSPNNAFAQPVFYSKLHPSTLPEDIEKIPIHQSV